MFCVTGLAYPTVSDYRAARGHVTLSGGPHKRPTRDCVMRNLPATDVLVHVARRGWEAEAHSRESVWLQRSEQARGAPNAYIAGAMRCLRRVRSAVLVSLRYMLKY